MIKNVILTLALGANLAAARPLLAQSAAQESGTPANATYFHEVVLGDLSPQSSLKGLRLTGDHIAWVEESAGKRTVRLDGQLQGGTYDDVENLRFSPGATHLVFFGKRGSSWMLVLDGHEQPDQYDKVSSVAFQPNGNSYAFLACQAKQFQLNVSGTKTGAVYESFTFPQYSRDGKRFAHFGKRDGKWVAVLDGKEAEPRMDDVWGSTWGFTEDGSHFYVAGRLNGKWTYIVDGQPGPGFDVVSPIAFTPDGRHFAYGGTNVKGGALKKKTLGTIVVDGKPGEIHEGGGMAGSLSVIGGAWQYMLGGVRYLNADFHGVSPPRFSPTGKLAYEVRGEKGGVALVLEREAGPLFQNILSPVAFSRDSSVLVYVAERAGEFQEIRNHQVIRNLSLSKTKRRTLSVPWIQMSADGAHLAYEIVSGDDTFSSGHSERALRSVVMDGKAGPEYNALGIENFDFSASARHYLYEVLGASGDKDLVNVDGRESGLYNNVWAAHFADDEKGVTFVALKERRLLRVTLPLE